MRARQIAKQLSCVPEKQEFSYIDTVYECQNEWIGWSNLVKLQRTKKKLNPIKNPFQIIIIIMMIMVAWNLLQCKLSQTVQHITLTIVNRRLDHHHHHYYSVYSQFQSRILKSNFHSNKYWCYANTYHRETYSRIECKKKRNSKLHRIE